MKMNVGDKVMYKAAFVKSCGYDKDIADMRGIITKDKGPVGKNTYFKVQWQGEDEEKGVLSCNICLAGKAELA